MYKLIHTTLHQHPQHALLNLDAAKAFQTLEPKDIAEAIRDTIPDLLPRATTWLNTKPHTSAT